MSGSWSQALVAVLMLLVVVAMAVFLRRFILVNSERRMLGMLTSMGIDPSVTTSGDIDRIMCEVRSRCRHCAVEGKCERWLRGEEAGDNAFCPNHKVFELLGKHSGRR